MDSLVNQLLFLARHEGRLVTESLKEIDLTIWLQELVQQREDAAKHLSFTSHRRSIQSRWKLTQTCCQAVMNLLNNACKYTPAGGTVCCDLTQSLQAVIQVSDSGIGIPRPLCRIFLSGFTVDTKRSRKTGGFGLG